MVAIRKFSFDQVFDSVERPARREPETEAPPPEPVFSRADLAAARDRGFSEGREAGAADALASVEHAAATTLAQINEALAALAPALGDAVQRCRQDAVGIAHAVTRKMIEQSDSDSAMTAVEAVISKVLPRIIDEPRVVIRVSDALLDPLQQRLSAVSESCGFPGSLILLAERDLQRPDCRIEWSDGGAEYDSGALWSEIDDIIERYRAEIAAGDRGAVRPVTDPAPAEQTNSEEHADG